jgi:hypothetical protein
MDRQVTCPRCQQRQTLPSPDGYRCASCGTRWVFARCRSCAGTFHMDPAAGSWVCPTCGTHNGRAVPAKPSPSRSPFSGSERIPLIAVVVVVVIAIALIWVKLKPEGGTTALVTPSSSAPLTAEQAIAKLCDDIPIDQNLRVDALRRTADQVRVDAEAIKAAGDRLTAKKAVAVAVAMEDFATTLETHGDTAANTADLSAAIEAVKPSCQAS